MLDKRIDEKVLYLRDYRLNESGLKIIYEDELSRIKILITFHSSVEYSQYKLVEKTFYVDDYIYGFICATKCQGPINPFFYKTMSDEEIRSLGLYVDENARSYTKYIMLDHDTLITVVSSVPPQVDIIGID